MRPGFFALPGRTTHRPASMIVGTLGQVDRTRDNITFVAGLLAIGFIVAGFFMWGHETATAEKQSTVNGFFNAIALDEGIRVTPRDTTVQPNHHLSIALYIAGGFAALTVLVFAASNRASRGTVATTISGQLAELNGLHASGSITTDEYVAAKTKLLSTDES